MKSVALTRTVTLMSRSPPFFSDPPADEVQATAVLQSYDMKETT